MADGSFMSASTAQAEKPSGAQAGTNRVMVFMPSYRGSPAGQTNSTIVDFAVQLSLRGWFENYISFGHYDIAKCRDHALTLWYDLYPQSTHLLMIDDDMSAKASLVLDMLAFNEPLIGTIYPTRSGEMDWVGKFLPNPIVRNGFMEMQGVGCGFMLIRRDAVDMMIAADPSIVISDPADKRLDRRMMRKLKIERTIGAFDHITTDDGILSEDFSFCERFRRAGGKVWAAATHKIGHVGSVEHADAFLRPLKGMTALSLVNMLRPERRTTVLDIGCSPIDEGIPYKRLLADGLCHVTGIDASAEAIKPLVEHQGPNEDYRTAVVGAGGIVDLHVMKAPGMTSVLKADTDTLSFLPGCEWWGDEERTETVQTQRLDAMFKRGFEYIKIDAQGAELDILEGAGNILADAVAVQLEVPFLPLYHDMPTFAEIDTRMRQLGFVLHRFVHLKAWPLSVLPNAKPDDCKQLLDGDVVYVRDFRRRENMTTEQWKHLAIVAHAVLDAPDLACGACGMVAPEMAEAYAKAFQ